MVPIEELLQYLVHKGGTDLHISAWCRPKIRIDGQLIDSEFEPFEPEECKRMVYTLLSDDQISRFEKNLELDLSFGVKGLGRFRTNVFLQRGTVAAALRLIPTEVRAFENLGLPSEICEELCSRPKGLILVTGATGSGKSTSLAALISHLNRTTRAHVVTIEDPIEFMHESDHCLINQRELGSDTYSFNGALRSVLRQDPDCVLVGEMRDVETIEAALTLAETGHLTFATLHTNDTIQTINRIVDVFPAYKQQQIRTQLSFTLQAVFCQQLLPRAQGRGMALALEILVVNSAVRSLIRDDKAHQIYSMLQTGRRFGMQTMNQSLADLYRDGNITYEDAITHSFDPEDLRRNLSRSGSSLSSLPESGRRQSHHV
jgi:twitching motility protein PilT